MIVEYKGSTIPMGSYNCDYEKLRGVAYSMGLLHGTSHRRGGEAEDIEYHCLGGSLWMTLMSYNIFL